MVVGGQLARGVAPPFELNLACWSPSYQGHVRVGRTMACVPLKLGGWTMEGWQSGRMRGS